MRLGRMRSRLAGKLGLLALFASVSTTALAGTTTYTYDVHGQLVTASYPGGTVITYSYDNAGNRTQLVTTVIAKPVANPDSESTPEGTAVTFDPRANDTQPYAATITAVGAAAHGSVTNNSGASLTYTPVIGYVGTDSFTYTITDTNNNTSSSTVTISISNVAPVANTDSITAYSSDVPVTFNPLANDTAGKGYSLTVTGVTASAHSQSSVSNNGTTITYQGLGAYVGTDSFQYTISDGHGGTATGTVNVNVLDVPPTASNYTLPYVIPEDTAVDVPVLMAVTAQPGHPVTISSVGSGAHGTTQVVTVTSSGTTSQQVLYTPTNGYAGSDSFQYTVSDADGGAATATASVTIRDTGPNASNQTVDTNANTAVTLNPIPNDTVPAGNTVTVTAVSTPAHGTVSISSKGVTYTPATNYSGVDSFQYTITDQYGESATGTINVGVSSQNLPPTAANESFSVLVNTTAGAQTPAITVNPTVNGDSDINGYAISVVSIGTPSSGTASLSGNSISWYGKQVGKNQNAQGTATIPYTITDPYGHQASGTITISWQAIAND